MAKKSAKKAAKKSTKRSVKKAAKKTAKRKAARRTAPVGLVAFVPDDSPVSRFFTAVETDADLQARIAAHNSRILDIAREFDPEFVFTYEEMANHLRERWGIMRGPREHYCCF
jgi:hypothetical protein